MANRNLAPIKGALDRGVVLLQGLISIAADASVSAVDIVGVESVENTGTGEYTITLEDQYNVLKSVQLQVGAAVAVDLVPQVLSEDVAGDKTIVFNLLAAAVPTDPAAVTSVYVSLVLKNSSVLP